MNNKLYSKKATLPNNKFILFTYLGHYPRGPIEDLAFGFDTLEQFTERLADREKDDIAEYFELLDTTDNTLYHFHDREEFMEQIQEIFKEG